MDKPCVYKGLGGSGTVQIRSAIWYQMGPLMKMILCGTVPYYFTWVELLLVVCWILGYVKWPIRSHWLCSRSQLTNQLGRKLLIKTNCDEVCNTWSALINSYHRLVCWLVRRGEALSEITELQTHTQGRIV